MTRRTIWPVIIFAAITSAALLRARTAASLSAHCPPDCPDCRPWLRRHEPYTSVRETGTDDPYCDRLQAEAQMLRAAGR